LWPETVEAIREAIDRRRAPKDEADVGLAFITKQGRPFVRGYAGEKGSTVVINGVTQEFGKLLKRLGINGHRGFYCLRHGFQTIGDESGDFIAVRTIMGHAFSGDISAMYRERVSDERLRKVTDHVRTWLFGERDGGKGAKPVAAKPRLRIVG
jgi:integrase